MKVVALVSGGKDSCYAMMRCIDYGHEIVALANLLPLDDSVDELDSYMFQTVGHQIVTSYAECMGLPLFRRRIRGSTKHHALGYSVTQGDEVEDMYVLLNEVKKQIPSVMAVSSGAIASDYQRLRVESVCSRLGLVSLAYLWKQDQTFLLKEMIRRGIIAITIKVAAIGLNPSKHLGKELVDLQDYLLRLKETYGINVCGEGGEYETLTLDCPIFRNARILLDESQVVLHSPDNIAPVGILHPLGFHIEHKEQFLSPSNCSSDINKEGSKYIFEVEDNDVTDNTVNSQNMNLSCNEEITKKLSISLSKGRNDFFSITCWVDGIPKTVGLQEDLTAILSKIELQLIENGFDWANVLYVHLYISDMKDFALANEIYVNFITQKKCYMGVPSRSTIELPLLQVGLGNAYVEVLVAKDCSKRVLHVQSISCWAPSCIGPYSQATLHKEILYMAGQLGLDPPTMKLHTGGAAMEMEQALLNCEAVANCFNTSLASATVLVVYCSTSLLVHERSKIQRQMEVFVGKCSDKQNLNGISNPMPLYILVPGLPKGALVEVKPVIHITDDGDIEAEYSCQPESCDKTDHLAFPYMEWHDSCYQIYIARRKICLAVVSVTEDLAAKICNIAREHLVPKDHMKDVAKFCFYILDKILRENGFFWEDMKHLKFYYTTRLCLAADFLQQVFTEHFADLNEVNRSIGMLPNFSLIPVLASGRSPQMDDIITCELFASKL